MKAPKILPWIARRAGISDELALKLWRRAFRESEVLVGANDGSEFWGLALDRFLELVDEESVTGLPPALLPSTRFTWMMKYQNRLYLLSIITAEHLYKFWHNVWTNVYQMRRLV